VCPRRLAETIGRGKARAVTEIGFPADYSPAYTMGGSGGGIAYNQERV
jgi:carbamoylphosphate synthase large subunit